MKNFIIVICFVVFLSSCSSTSHTYRDNFIQNKPVVTSEVVVDVQVDLNKKIESTSSKRKTVELAKSEAYYKAISENNIDIVVDPIFETRTSDKFLFFGGKTTVKLKGFAGYYVNPRTKVDAIKELKLVDTLDIHKYNNIYMGIPFPVRKIKVISDKAKIVSSTISLNTGIKSVVKKNESKPLKSNFGFKITKATNNFDYLNSSVLISQGKKWIEDKNLNNFQDIFSCTNSNDIVSELFFLIANLYSSQNDYEKSNFYLNIANYLNPKFIFNLSLLAENYYLNNDYSNTLKTLEVFDKKYEFYYWFKLKKESQIILKKSDQETSLNFINKKFKAIKNPNKKIIFDIANMHKNAKRYIEAISFYDQILLKMDVNSALYG